MTPALELVNIRAAYGGIEVLHDVTITVPPVGITALLGANGAGKSTVLKVASGRLRPTTGSVCFRGSDIAGRQPEDLARAGLCTIPEGRAVFPNLRVVDHFAMWSFRGRSREARTIAERTFSYFPKLALRRHQVAGTLSGGEQQMLAMSRALTTDPQVLLLDEISMGLAPVIVEELYDVISGLTSAGLAILLAEQYARTALAVADRVIFMAGGRVLADGPAADLGPSVIAAYLRGEFPAVPSPIST